MGSRKRLLGPIVLAVFILLVCWILVTGPVLAVDCSDTLYECWNNADDLDYDFAISDNDSHIQMQQFEALSTHTVTSVKLGLFSDNWLGGSEITVELWTAVDMGVNDWEPDVLLSSGTYDFNSITAEFVNWDWYCINLTPTVIIDNFSHYCILVWFFGESAVGQHEVIYWVHDETEDADNIFDSSDNGTTWANEAGSADCLYEVYGGDPVVPADSMFEVWGEADPPYGVFIAAVPALFKLATLLGTILAAILVLRGRKPNGLGGGYG